MLHQTLTLAAAVDRPDLATYVLSLPDGQPVVYRPLRTDDVDRLTEFLESLSPRTRHFWNLDAYNRGQAQELCAAINRFDKFRMVALSEGSQDALILATFDFALTVGNELNRIREYGVALPEADTCRFGPCVRDAYQGRGLGSLLMPPTLDIARRFGMRHIVLWGGVFQENVAAVRFYQKHGFRNMGTFKEPQGNDCFDMVLHLND